MANFKGQKRGKSHVQNMGIFFGVSGHGSESLCQISVYNKFFLDFNVFCRISTGLVAAALEKPKYSKSLKGKRIGLVKEDLDDQAFWRRDARFIRGREIADNRYSFF